MKNNLLLCFAFFVSFTSAAITVPARTASYCAYLSKKIFCYGGSPNDSRYDNRVYVLDFHNQTNGRLLEDLASSWNEVSPHDSNTSTLEYRYDAQFMPLPDDTNMFFNGGSNDNQNPQEFITTTYNTTDNIWRKLPSFNDLRNRGGDRQIKAAATVYIPHINSIGVYGGHEFHAELDIGYITITNKTLPSYLSYVYPSEQYPDIDLTGSSVGYYYMTLFNLDTRTWKEVPTEPLQSPQNGPFLFSYQTATFHPRSGKVYFIGGFYRTGESYDMIVPLFYAITYDTYTASWGNQTLNPSNTGDMPSPRHRHTATMLHTKEDILIYGGSTKFDPEPFLAVEDYMFSLNLETHTWTKHDPLLPTGFVGSRYYHCAVLVNETYVFILFGADKNRTVLSDMAILDTRDVSQISFSVINPFSSSTGDPQPKNTVQSQNTNLPKGISIGAIIGIVVGILVLLSGILFCIWKRRGKNKEKITQMEVDWDKIDNSYNQVPPLPNRDVQYLKTLSYNSDSSTQVPFSPVESPTTVRNSLTQVIFSSPNESPITTVRSSVNTYIMKPEQDIAKPDIFDDSIRDPKSNNNITIPDTPVL